MFLTSGAGDLRPHRQGLLAQHRALDLRHLDAGQRHRQRDRQDRRRQLVLPDRRLRLRPCARARHRRPWSSRPAARCWARCAIRFPGSDFSSFLLQAQASKAKIDRPGQRRRRHHQLDQAGGRVRHRQGRTEPRRPAGVHHRRPRAGPEHGQGLVFTETFYWDLNDQTRAFDQALPAQAPRNNYPTMVQAGVYCVGAALPEGGRGDQERRRHQGGRADEEDADRRPAVRQGHDPRRRPQAAPGLPVRGEEAVRSRKGRGTTTSCAPRSRPTRRSAR